MSQEFATALKYVRALLQVEPGNRQAQVGREEEELEEELEQNVQIMLHPRSWRAW